MRLRTLLTTAVASALIAGAIGPSAQATPVASPTPAGEVVPWGDTENSSAAAAMDIPDLTAPVAALATTSRAAAAVTADGHLVAWGVEAALEASLAPQDVTDATAVALAPNAGLVLHRDGTVTGWGSAALENVPDGLRAKAIAVSSTGNAYAVTTGGTVEAWGATPVTGLDDLTNVVDVAAGNFHVVALKSDGTLDARFEPTGDAGQDAFLAQLTDLSEVEGKKVTQIDASSMATGAVLEDGGIAVWGLSVPANEPVDVFGPENEVVNLDVADANAGAVTKDGAVHLWGANNAIISEYPDSSLDGAPVASVALGARHALAIVTTFRAVTNPTVAGTPQVDQTLTATPATFSLVPDSPATGQWYVGSTPITGQTGTTLALDESMLDKSISYRSTATRDGETVTASSNVVGPVTAVPQPQVDNPAAKADSKITKVKVKATGKTKKVAKKVKVAIKVKTAKGVSPKGKVAIALKGKTKKKAVAKVNAKGKATVVVKKVKRGKYQVKLKYRGNADVAPAKKTVKAKV